MTIWHLIPYDIRERSQMTSSKIKGFQTSSLIFRHLPSLLPDPLDDVIFYSSPFPQDNFRQYCFNGKIEKLRIQDLTMNIIQTLKSANIIYSHTLPHVINNSLNVNYSIS